MKIEIAASILSAKKTAKAWALVLDIPEPFQKVAAALAISGEDFDVVFKDELDRENRLEAIVGGAGLDVFEQWTLTLLADPSSPQAAALSTMARARQFKVSFEPVAVDEPPVDLETEAMEDVGS